MLAGERSEALPESRSVRAILASVAAATNKPQLRHPGETDRVTAESPLVTIQSGSQSKPPLFCVHAEAGDVSLYYALASYLQADQPVLGLCAPAAGEAGKPGERWQYEWTRTFELMAERHVRAITGVQPDGPYLIVGECTGGALAYEIARQLRADGRQVALLALIDAFPPDAPRLRPYMPRPAYRIVHRARILAFHLANLIRLDMGAKLTYVAKKAGRARVALMTKVRETLSRSATSGPSPRLAFGRAFAAYNPEPYAGSMVLLRAAKMPFGAQVAPDMGWESLVDDLRIETIAGYFTTPISEPEVRVLADRLSRYLAASGT